MYSGRTGTRQYSTNGRSIDGDGVEARVNDTEQKTRGSEVGGSLGTHTQQKNSFKQLVGFP